MDPSTCTSGIVTINLGAMDKKKKYIYKGLGQATTLAKFWLTGFTCIGEYDYLP